MENVIIGLNITSLGGIAYYTQFDKKTSEAYILTQSVEKPVKAYLLWLSPCSVLFFSHPRSQSWPHHGHTFSIYPCPLSFWLTLPRRVLSTSWCCPSRPCMAFLACMHLELFLAFSLSPGNSLVSSWCDHSMLASLLWQCLTIPSLLQLC